MAAVLVLMAAVLVLMAAVPACVAAVLTQKGVFFFAEIGPYWLHVAGTYDGCALPYLRSHIGPYPRAVRTSHSAIP
eukprot:72985-Rhodomonas_salina.1